MHDAIQRLTGFLLYYLTHSMVALLVVAAAAWLGDHAMRRVGPSAQHRVWVCAFLSSIALPLLPANVPCLITAQAGGNNTALSTVVSFSRTIPPHESWTLSSSLASALAFTYLLSVLFGATRLLWRWWRTQQLLRGSVPAGQSSWTVTLVQEVAQRLAVIDPEIRCSPRVNGPVVFGSVVVVPEGFLERERIDDIFAALAHECAHIARHDCTWNLLYEFVAVLVAYHPAWWWIRRRLAETRELVCDELAAVAIADRCLYAGSLLRLATTMADRVAKIPINAIGIFDAHILEERIMRLTNNVPRLSSVRRVLLGSVAACCLLAGAVSATAMAFDISPQLNDTVYKVGHGASAPVLIRAVDPQFPPAEWKVKKAGWRGVCVLRLTVDSKGMPQNIRVERSLSPDFDEKAISAAREYRFKPAIRDGKPVAVSLEIEVDFRRK